MPLSSIRLIGRHLVADVMAAATVAQIAGVPHDAIVRAVESFTGLEHALEPVAVVGGVRFVNDSKATNVEAAKRAIEASTDGLVVIMGGRFKSGDFALLREPLRSRQASRRGDRRSDTADSRVRSRAVLCASRNAGVAAARVQTACVEAFDLAADGRERSSARARVREL